MFELTPDEIFVLKKMREVQGHAVFRIYKQPTKDNKQGELVRIVSEISDLIEKDLHLKTDCGIMVNN